MIRMFGRGRRLAAAVDRRAPWAAGKRTPASVAAAPASAAPAALSIVRRESRADAIWAGSPPGSAGSAGATTGASVSAGSNWLASGSLGQDGVTSGSFRAAVLGSDLRYQA